MLPETTPIAEADVRSRILREATALFAERGVAGTSLQLVADAAGITKPTLVYHFGSKEGLREAVLSGLVGHWRGELPRLMLAAAAGGPRLDALLQALFRFFLEDRNRARLVLRELLDAPEAVRAVLRRELQPWTALLTEAIRSGQESGVLRPEVDPSAYTLLVVTSTIGVLAAGDRSSALLAPEPTLDEQLAELIRIARVALVAPRAEREEV